jgi:hypothetical protein
VDEAASLRFLHFAVYRYPTLPMGLKMETIRRRFLMTGAMVELKEVMQT